MTRRKGTSCHLTIAKVEESTNAVVTETSRAMKNVEELTNSAKTFVYSVGASAQSSPVDNNSVSQDPQLNIKTLMENLKFDEYGPWYLVGATVLYAITAKEMGKKEARGVYESELEMAKDKAEEAADAAAIAAEGAKMAKQLVKDIDMSSTGVDVGKVLLESTKVQELQVENVSRIVVVWSGLIHVSRQRYEILIRRCFDF